MNDIKGLAAWIDAQKLSLVDTLQKWSDINSGSDNLAGLQTMLRALQLQFAQLPGNLQIVKLPQSQIVTKTGKIVFLESAEALSLKKETTKPAIRVLLCGHMDTVYHSSHPFQTSTMVSPDRMTGPGTADMKGGLVIMLTSLLALEQHPLAKDIDWEVLIVPDEETGSVASHQLLEEAARRNDIGLIFEPALPDGALVSSRKGSANFTVIVKGRAAHAGRDFHEGRSAVVALAKFIAKIDQMNNSDANHPSSLTVNAGNIFSEGPVNIVPDLASCEVNIRADTSKELQSHIALLHEVAEEFSKEGIAFTIHTHHIRPPKIFDDRTKELFKMLDDCAKEEGYSLSYRKSGGVTDGNTLAENGLAVIDTLGAIGGNIHTPDEYVLVDSLTSRAKLTLRLLIALCSKAKGSDTSHKR